jgi:hypothetical protein
MLAHAYEIDATSPTDESCQKDTPTAVKQIDSWRHRTKQMTLGTQMGICPSNIQREWHP